LLAADLAKHDGSRESADAVDLPSDHGDGKVLPHEPVSVSLKGTQRLQRTNLGHIRQRWKVRRRRCDRPLIRSIWDRPVGGESPPLTRGRCCAIHPHGPLAGLEIPR
jgi:hypothetical protein